MATGKDRNNVETKVNVAVNQKGQSHVVEQVVFDGKVVPDNHPGVKQ